MCTTAGNVQTMRQAQGGGGGGGGTLIFSHIRRLGLFLGGSKFWISIFFGGSEKWVFFWGMKILWIFLGGHHKIGLVWGSFLCNLGSFLRSMYRIGIFFWVAKNSNIFWGAWNSWYFLGVNGRCWVRAYARVCGKNRVPTPPPPLGETRPRGYRSFYAQLNWACNFNYSLNLKLWKK